MTTDHGVRRCQPAPVSLTADVFEKKLNTLCQCSSHRGHDGGGGLHHNWSRDNFHFTRLQKDEMFGTPILLQTAAAIVFSAKNCTRKVPSVSSETQPPPRYWVQMLAADTMVGRHFPLDIKGLVYCWFRVPEAG